MPPRSKANLLEDRRNYWNLKRRPYFSNKGLYIISIPSLAKRGIYKIGYSGISLKERLKQFHDVLCPSFGEPLYVYALVVPRAGKDVPANTKPPPPGKKRAPAQKHIRGEDLRELEGLMHKLYQKYDERLKYPDSKRYSEWIKEKNRQTLLDTLQQTYDDTDFDFRVNFNVKII